MSRDIEEFLRKAAARRKQAQQNQPEIVEARVAEPEPPIRQLTPTVDTSHIAEHTHALGQKVGQADEKLEARLHQKFDHSVGHLHTASLGDSSSPMTVAKPTPHLASDLLKMLSSPQSVRQAILLKEVLDRPVSRW